VWLHQIHFESAISTTDQPPSAAEFSAIKVKNTRERMEKTHLRTLEEDLTGEYRIVESKIFREIFFALQIILN
jgi:hypothetical protein